DFVFGRAGDFFDMIAFPLLPWSPRFITQVLNRSMQFKGESDTSQPFCAARPPFHVGTAVSNQGTFGPTDQLLTRDECSSAANYATPRTCEAGLESCWRAPPGISRNFLSCLACSVTSLCGNPLVAKAISGPQPHSSSRPIRPGSSRMAGSRKVLKRSS